MSDLKTKQPIYLYGAWLVSVIATLGSLYFSEIRGFTPCELCWYQRILMYPLALILGIGTFQNDSSVKRFVLPMAITGWFISSYHYLLQKVPGFAPIKPCANGVPCNAQYINWGGFITIPFLAFTAFTLIIIFMFLLKASKNETK
ncbi:disulfide bond formation protein B [Bacillus sp. ISL-4]|uniref:disulfide oxidoreductase n=1 Tax=Bacillus sp. ISL-4 TaxID=2819125 RepID=UPI001BE76358|nr:disulfide oxidoreductase [Bacillus sp. ISL-4]MBT2666156.1 disulfide bond formation protein B [Bacillus sp. ISL-4]MBT2670194.1 disulfide bond formation protein B [Streptomyces sp. ISL-14]